jgi:hypothetical protein
VRGYLPAGADGIRAETYSSAVEIYDRPQACFDSSAYRLLDVAPGGAAADGAAVTLTFTMARYFDGQDTAEFLAHEAAARDGAAKRRLAGGPYRRWLADPFRFGQRAALPGISALTIRCADQGAFFFMHRRDPGKVAVAMNATNVAPAGEFQPHDDVIPVWRTDLSIWNNVMREYAEEFLGRAEAAGQGGSVIDFERHEPYRQFARALRDGGVTVWFLGIGLDPLTWKPEICVACLWKASAFDRIFTDNVDVNTKAS